MMINGATKVSGANGMGEPPLGYPSAWALEAIEKTPRKGAALASQWPDWAVVLFNRGPFGRMAAVFALLVLLGVFLAGAIECAKIGIRMADRIAGAGETNHELSLFETIDSGSAKREALTLLGVAEKLATESRLLLPLEVIELDRMSMTTSIKGGRSLDVTSDLATNSSFLRSAYEAFGQDKDHPMWGSPLSNSHGGRVEISLSGVRSFRIFSHGIPATRCIGMIAALDGIVGQAYLNGRISIDKGRMEPLAAVRQACSIKGGATIELRGGE